MNTDNRPFYLFVACVVGVAALAATLIGLNFLPRKASSANLSPYTELYFTNHTQLPNQIVASKTYDFSFTVRNLESQDMTYAYEVYLQLDQEKIPIKLGDISILRNKSETIPIKFGPLKPARTKLVVNLINQSQWIAFWMDK